MTPAITELVAADSPDAWRAAGFTVGNDGVIRVGHVVIRLVGRERGQRLRSWAWTDLPGDGDLDGLVTTTGSSGLTEPAHHPNGAVLLDHVVVTTPDVDRTIAAFEGRGLDIRRVRHTDQYGPPFRQVFFRGGEVLVEVIGPDQPTGDDPARLYGLAFTVTDLDATAELLGERLGRVKDAVQPGRRIAALRHHDVDVSVPVAFMSD